VIRYVVRRLLSGLLLVFVLTLITFGLFWVVPAEPWRAIYPDPFAHPTAAQKAAAEHKLGVDRPVLVQYGKFVWRLVRHGDFGRGYYGGSVNGVLRSTLPVTGSIVLGGAVILFLLAVPLATISALHANRALDRTILAVSILGVALHPFIIGIGLKALFADRLHLLPPNLYCPLQAPKVVPSIYQSAAPADVCGGPLDWARHLVLPWITFAVIFLPIYLRMLRNSVVEILGEQYVTAARARGAGTVRLIRAHVLRNALLQPLTMIGLEIGLALTVSIYIETIFHLGGVGTLAVGALGYGTFSGGGNQFDLPVLAGIVFTIALAVILLNLLVDLAYAVLDPRIRLRGTA
jgi:peptide/nickel transport system permease protein